jgi:hypothetical protein
LSTGESQENRPFLAELRKKCGFFAGFWTARPVESYFPRADMSAENLGAAAGFQSDEGKVGISLAERITVETQQPARGNRPEATGLAPECAVLAA